jgi:predicted aldo/keto reductase-like oxidoreductase
MENEIKLPRIKLGKSGLSASVLGLGGFHQVEVSSEIVSQVVERYLELGGNYIETARGYGHGASEEKIGKALGGKRDQVILVSKTEDRTRDGAWSELESTLKDIRSNHLDFYFFHCVDPPGLDQTLVKGGALEAFVEARNQGLIRGFGFSSHYPDLYLPALDQLDLDVILIWNNFLEDLNFPIIREEVFPKAKEKGVAITGMKPLADGYLYQEVETSIRYALGTESDVLICGTNGVSQLEEVASAVVKGPLSEEETEVLMKNSISLGNYVCRRCEDCPEDVKELFRFEGMLDRQMVDFYPHDPANYALRMRLGRWFGRKDDAKAEFKKAGFKLESLSDSIKSVQCPYKIDIERKVRIAFAKLNGDEVNRL